MAIFVSGLTRSVRACLSNTRTSLTHEHINQSALGPLGLPPRSGYIPAPHRRIPLLCHPPAQEKHGKQSIGSVLLCSLYCNRILACGIPRGWIHWTYSSRNHPEENDQLHLSHSVHLLWLQDPMARNYNTAQSLSKFPLARST